MKGLKRFEIHNYWAEPYVKVHFDKEGNIITGNSKGFVNYFLEYIFTGLFLDEKHSIRRRLTYHKPRKNESKFGRYKNLYVLAEFYTKTGNPSFLEIYVYDDHSRDYLHACIDGIGYTFMFDEGNLTQELFSVMMNNIVETVDL